MSRPTARDLIKGLSGQTLRYLLVAGTTALAYLSLVAGGISLGLHYFVAILCAQTITIVCAFPFYRRFVFRSRSRISVDFLRFVTVWSSGMIAGLLVTPVFVEFLGWDPLIAQIFAIAVVSVASFLGHKFFSFRSASSTDAKK